MIFNQFGCAAYWLSPTPRFERALVVITLKYAFSWLVAMSVESETLLLLPASAYQGAAQKLFESYAKKLRQLLPAARIEHVGASAVPGAWSKGDLDIFVGVPAQQHANAVEKISQLGFTIKPDTLRTEALCMLDSVGDQDVAIQLVANGSKFEFFLQFRDLLRAHPKLLQEYNLLKQEHKDLGHAAYRTAKSEFIEQVLHRCVQSSVESDH